MEYKSIKIGIYKGEELVDLMKYMIEYHLDIYETTLSEYEPLQLYSNWRSIVRTIDEFINIPFELSNDECIKEYLNLSLINENSLEKGFEFKSKLSKEFNENIGTRFFQMFMMYYYLNFSYSTNNRNGIGLTFSNVNETINHLQSRRIYYLTTLHLIPKKAKGDITFQYIDTLNQLHHTIDRCLINISSAYYNILLNSCLDDFQVTYNGISFTRSIMYNHLEGFFMEPESLSLINQLEFRNNQIQRYHTFPIPPNQIFSFIEVANTMNIFEAVFAKYEIRTLEAFSELNNFFYSIAPYIVDDFNVEIESKIFESITSQFKKIHPYDESDDYFTILNSPSTFQKINGHYYSTVVQLTRFIYRTLSLELLKNKSFRINSGFVFEDMVKDVLEKNGFYLTEIKRINHKEFDVITIKKNVIYNFQCKNNLINTSKVGFEIKRIAKLNKTLCKKYKQALQKEQNREDLILDKLGNLPIYHFVISRFPVITNDIQIINYVDLENRIKNL